MKIGIFGDSFAAHQQNEKYWPVRLSKKYEVTNYALSGSGIKYSYTLYKEKKNKFDKIIFVASTYNRFYLHSHWHNKLPGIPKQYLHFNGTEPLRDIDDQNFESNQFLKTISYISNQFNIYFGEEPKTTKHLANVIYNDIFKDGNVLLLKAFRDTDETYHCHNQVPLIDIALTDKKYNACNHMDFTMHDWFYKKVEKWIIEDKFSLTYNDIKEMEKLRAKG